MSIARHIALSLARHGLAIVSGIVTVALLGRCLGRASLGVWALIGSSSALVALSDLGLASLVLRSSTRGEKREAISALLLAQRTVLFVSPILSVASSLLYTADLRKGADAVALREVWLACVATVASAAIGAYFAGHRSWLTGVGDTSALARARAMASAAQVGTTAAALAAGGGIVAPALGALVAAVVEAMVCSQALREELESLRSEAYPPTFARWRASIRDASASLAVNAAVVVAVRIDVVLLARVAPLAAVGAYQLSLRVTDQLFTLAKQVSAALLHRLASAEGCAESLSRGTVLIAAPLASVLVALSVAGRPIVRAWAGAIVDEPLFSTAFALTAAASTIAASCELGSAALMVGARSVWSSGWSHIAGSTVNAMVSFGGAARFGVWAIAGGTIAGNLTTAVLTQLQLEKAGRVRRGGLDRAYVTTALAALVSWVVTSALHRSAASLVEACAVVTVGAGSGLLVVWGGTVVEQREVERCASHSYPRG